MAKPKAADRKSEDDYLESVKRKATVSMDMLDAARRQAQVYQRYYDGDVCQRSARSTALSELSQGSISRCAT